MRDTCVLVVQHEPALLELISAELGRGGIGIAGPVGDVARAVARAAGQVLDAVLLDLYLPGSRGLATLAGFRAGNPGLPVVVTVPRRCEAEAREAIAQGARQYILHEELGRGLLAPVLLHEAGAARQDAADSEAARRLLHDLGNLLAIVSGGMETLLEGMDGPLAAEARELHAAASESVRVFRRFVAARRAGADG